MLKALVMHGWNFEQIAMRVGTNKQYLQHVVSRNPAVNPNYDLAQALTKLYTTHVGAPKL